MSVVRQDNEILLSFEDDIFLKGAEGVYSVSPAPEWASLDTWQYEGKNCLVSTNHKDSHEGDIVFNITLIQDGELEFNYVSSSESGYDYLKLIIDGSEKMSSKGSDHQNFTLVKQPLMEGNHTVKFTYRKDGSGTTGKDAVGIGYIKFTGVEEPVIRKYLITDNTGKLYTIKNGVLTDTGSTAAQLNSSLFISNGFEKDSFDYQVFKDLNGIKIYQWLDKDRIHGITATATPNSQIIEGVADLTDPTVLGLNSVSAEGTDVTVAYSVDEKTYTEYMTLSSFAAIDVDALYKSAPQKKIWFKIKIPGDATFKGIFFNCVNEKGDS